MLAAVRRRAGGRRAALERRPARFVLASASVALALLTVILALLFVAVVLVAAMEGSVIEVARVTNVASAVGEALSGQVLSVGPDTEPSARVCWFSRCGTCR